MSHGRTWYRCARPIAKARTVATWNGRRSRYRPARSQGLQITSASSLVVANSSLAPTYFKLLDVPLLERHRLLESVLAQGPLVRVSVLCRPPIDPWVATWQASGLRGGMLKAANGRYLPGDRSPEWRAVTKLASKR